MNKPVLSQLQRHWLQEIGIDARMLAHFSTEPYGQEPLVAAPPVSRQAGAEPAASPERTAAAVPPQEPPAVDRAASPGAALIADLLKRKPGRRAPLSSPGITDAPAPAAGTLPEGTLHELRKHAEECQACGLHEVRGKVVFGEGAEAAPKWMFIGEAPGEYDDTLGQPFKGRAGELLQAMLQSIGMTDDTPAYFTNVLKCRPMGNRSPHASEISACLPLLRRQILALKPASLVALGRVSAGALLGVDGDLDSLRGQVHQYVDEEGRSIPLVVTHHPASLLLHGQLKAEAWRDLNLLADLDA